MRSQRSNIRLRHPVQSKRRLEKALSFLGVILPIALENWSIVQSTVQIVSDILLQRCP